MRKTPALVGILILGAALAGGAHALLSEGGAPAPPPSQQVAAGITLERPAAASPDAPAPLAAPRPLPTRLRLEAGEWWRYACETSHRAEGSPEGLALGGSVEVRCYAAGPGGYLLGERYRLQAEADGHAALAAAASREVLLQLDEQGQLLELALPPDADPDTRNLLRTLVVARRVVLPRQVSERWQAIGEDTTGRFVAEYRREGEEVRRVRAYEALHARQAADAEVSVAGELGGLLRADGRAERWAGEELIRVGAPALPGQAAQSLSVRSSYAWTWVAEGRFDDPAGALSAVEGALGPAAWTLGLAGELGGERQTAPLRPFDELAAELARISLGSSEDFTQAAPGLFVELRERFLRDPAAVARAALMARRRGDDLRLRSTLIDALGSAGTPAAQRELLALRGEVEDELLPSVYLGLAEATQPLPEVVETLQAEGREPGARRDHARRAQGWLASRAVDPLLRQALAAELEGSLGESAPEDRVILEALGNAGQARSLPAIQSYLEAEEPESRAAAAAALRKLSVEQAGALLEGALADPSPAVRVEAVRSLGSQPPAPAALSALGRVLRQDPDARVGLEAIETLAGWLEGQGEAGPERAQIKALLEAATRSVEEAIATRAREVLEG